MIYFDYAATSIKRKNIFKHIFENMDNYNGNPDSQHALGRNSKKILDDARSKIARSIGAEEGQIIFLSGATEANNMVIKNYESGEIICSEIEHHSILEPLSESEVHFVKPEKNGKVDISKILKLINENTRLICLMYVNNETGCIQDVKELGEILEKLRKEYPHIHYHVDAVQAYGYEDIDVKQIKCDSLCISGHKIGAENGFGVLYVKGSIKSIIKGGKQERSRRAGTSFIMGAVSMYMAYEETLRDKFKIFDLKKYFLENLKKSKIDYQLNGESETHIVNVYFPFIKSDFLITYLDMKGICVSAGSACNSGSLEHSYVIKSMYDEERAEKSVRFSFGFENTKEEVDSFIDIISELYERNKNERK